MADRKQKACVFGPVPSRRLGRSLGIDLVPFKTCSYDCTYCQIGRTTVRTTDRREWVPFDQVVAELEARLDSAPDYITLSGVGEPTLYSRLGELIRRIKGMTDIPVAVLTNGSLLWRADVRADLVTADLVSPSLDAGDEETFRRVNRPVEGLSFDRMREGLIAFRREYAGKYWLEVLLLAGVTDTDEQVARIAAAAAQIRPDRIQLNTVTRPAADSDARAVSAERLAELAGRFDPPAEVIADFRAAKDVAGKGTAEAVFDMIRRHPSTAADLAAGLGISPADADRLAGELLAEGRIVATVTGGRAYYKVVADEP